MNYEPGRVAVFHKRSRGGFRPGEQWEVCRRDHDGTVNVQRHGQEKPLDLDTAQNFEVYPAATTPVAPGDQLRITSNFRSNGDRFINNELVKVPLKQLVAWQTKKKTRLDPFKLALVKTELEGRVGRRLLSRV